ncbi:MAG: zinc ABC transporter substrate-binding protein [Clostridiales bacterium]|nr:zinc ABC transporter substrate-binding protein [Clostridiales bacterium]
MKKGKLVIAITSLILLLAIGCLCVVYFVTNEKYAKVIVTTFPVYDIARELLGSDEELILLQSGGGDLHNFEPNAQEIIAIGNCELLIAIGGDSDNRWLDKTIESSENTDIKLLKLIDCVDKVHIGEDGTICHDEHNHKHDEESFDEHIWLSVKNAIKMTTAIKENLLKVFPELTKLIEKNYNSYLTKLTNLEKEYMETLSGLGKEIIVADRFPFAYLMNDYNLDYLALFPSCSTDANASSEAIAKMIDNINEKNAKSIYILESTKDTVAKNIVNGCANQDIEILRLNSCQTISEKNIKNSHYIDIMKENLDNLKKAK